MDLVTFVSTLLVGAVGGWMIEQEVGPQLVRWTRVQRMKMRLQRRNERGE